MQKIHTFKSGLRLIVNTMQSLNSVCLSVFVNTGSVNEDDNNNGISHFIEHCLFKGTKTKSAKDIAAIADEVEIKESNFATKINFLVDKVKEPFTKISFKNKKSILILSRCFGVI